MSSEQFKIEKIKGKSLPLRGDAIDTDRIYPARYLRTVTFTGTEQYLFADDKQTNPAHPLNLSQFADAGILIVEKNFGCGSSREHAPQALKRRGFRAIVGVSFGEIFFYNSLAIGLPCLSVGENDVNFLLETIENQPATEIEVNLKNLTATIEEKVLSLTLGESARRQFLEGTWNSTLTLLQAGNLIEETANRSYPEGGHPAHG